jgi:7,8-dihydropterin-6-yl-methyl-4-(beta-D-ribofuranosyl)aminobenzene 5'-phosphate synthase
MNATVRIMVVVEDTVRKQGLLGEHGLSFWIDTGAHCVLFDTGQGHVLAPNSSRLQIDLARADAIVLSHGHYDHTGGLRIAFHMANRAKLYLHPQAVIRRYAGSGDQGREIGWASLTKQELRQKEHRRVWTTSPTQVVPGLFATGEIPRQTDYEDTGENFFLDAACREPDPILDDQAVYMDTAAGVVVIQGCAHAGVINTLNYIRQVTQRPIHGVIGGTHLVNASPERMTRTIAALRGMNLKFIAPGHCTGPRATAALWTAFPEIVTDCSVGMQWEFPTTLERNP